MQLALLLARILALLFTFAFVAGRVALAESASKRAFARIGNPVRAKVLGET